jgi:hypothetical protein
VTGKKKQKQNKPQFFFFFFLSLNRADGIDDGVDLKVGRRAGPRGEHNQCRALTLGWNGTV